MRLQALKRPGLPLHSEMATLLRNRIMSGELAPNERIPTLSTLSKDLGVAIMTVRQAMDTLEAEGLIERIPGRGTFVREVTLPQRRMLHMQANLGQLLKLVDSLAVSVTVSSTDSSEDGPSGQFKIMKRIHNLHGRAFCLVELSLLRSIYDCAPDRFSSEIVVAVLKDMGVPIKTARQEVTISYASIEAATELAIPVNSPVMRVYREICGADGGPIYTATLVYPGDALGFEIEFSIPD